MKALVTGIAGDIGNGVGRILREFGMFDEVHGVDIFSNHNGKLIFDKCANSIPASNENYLIWLSDYAKQHRISLVIPTSEAEIWKLSDKRTELTRPFKILVNKAHIVATCLDKFQTMKFLQKHGVRIPNFGLVGVKHPIQFPVVVKPRKGRGSIGMKILNSDRELTNYNDNYVWQDLLTPSTEEYTCAIYKSPKIKMRTLIMKRVLHGGLTISGEVIEDAQIEHYVHEIAEAFKLDGLINIQLIKTDCGPILFEINPRLSSTLVFRDKMGFADLRWWIQDSLGETADDFQKPKSGTHFYLGTTELIFQHGQIAHI